MNRKLNPIQLLELERGAGLFTHCPKGEYLATINKALTLKGFGEEGATIDCGGTGGGIQIGPTPTPAPTPTPTPLISQVTIQGFHLRNMDGTLAGGVEASNVRALSITSSTFENCYGFQAGAILVQGTSG